MPRSVGLTFALPLGCHSLPMSTTSTRNAGPSLPERLFQHSNAWGKVWFGVLFWGSILAAGIQTVSPSISSPLAYAIGGAIGLTIGLVARARDRWI